MHHIERSQSTEAGSCLRSDKAQVLEVRRESCFGTGGSSLVVMVGGGGLWFWKMRPLPRLDVCIMAGLGFLSSQKLV